MHTDLYNWNVFENSEYHPIFDNVVKYSELYLDTTLSRFKEIALTAAVNCLLSEYSSLTKTEQRQLLDIHNMLKAG